MPEWFSPQRGYYIAKYQGRTLEIIRNPDATDKRRYVVQIDSVILPHSCFSIPQAKTKAIRYVENPGLDRLGDIDGQPGEERPPPEPPVNGAIIPYTDPDTPSLTGVDVMIAFRIVGKIPADKFSLAVSNLQAAVDMLRDEGGEVVCDIEPPGKVQL